MLPSTIDGSDNNNYLNSLSQFQYMDDKKSSMIPPPPPPPFMVPPLPFDGDMSRPRKRTRTTPEQLAVLEKSFILSPSPNSRTREQLSLQLGMPERSIQIWFQNRRAKVKNQAKRTMQVQDKTLYMQQQYAASAAAAACQSAAVQQQQSSIDPNLYNYYYYYYFQQIQEQQSSRTDTNLGPSMTESTMHNQLTSPTPISSYPNNLWIPNTSSATPDLVLSASTSSSSTTSDHHRQSYKRHPAISSTSGRTRAHSVGPYPCFNRSKFMQQERHASLGPPVSQPSSAYVGGYMPSTDIYSSTIMEEPIATNRLAAGPVEQVYPLTTETLQIGTWKRVCHLSCQIDLNTHTLIWCIGDEQQDQSFRMDIDLSLVQSIQIKHTGLHILLSTPQHIKFYMTTDGNEWIQCHDFTQDQQGSSVHLHVLEGLSLGVELVDVLMQAPELQSLIIENDGMTDNLLLLQSLHLPS